MYNRSSRPFVYDDVDFGFNTPREVSGDFGARGAAYGLGAAAYLGMQDGGGSSSNAGVFQLEADQGDISQADADAEAAMQRQLSQAQSDANSAAAQVVQLQKELDDVQTQANMATGAVAASLQQQISDLSSQLSFSKQNAVAAQAKVSSLSSALSPLKKYAVPLAIGLVAVIAIAMAVKASKGRKLSHA